MFGWVETPQEENDREIANLEASMEATRQKLRETRDCGGRDLSSLGSRRVKTAPQVPPRDTVNVDGVGLIRQCLPWTPDAVVKDSFRQRGGETADDTRARCQMRVAELAEELEMPIAVSGTFFSR